MQAAALVYTADRRFLAVRLSDGRLTFDEVLDVGPYTSARIRERARRAPSLALSVSGLARMIAEVLLAAR